MPGKTKERKQTWIQKWAAKQGDKFIDNARKRSQSGVGSGNKPDVFGTHRNRDFFHSNTTESGSVNDNT